MDGHELLQRLLDNPTETLSVEVKRWLDPKSEAGIEKIAKGCLALFNNNGGHMIVGICDDGTPDNDNIPADVRATFHPDVIQSIVSKFSYTPFEVQVEFRSRDGQEYPIFKVPSGVRTPAVTKSQLGKINPDDVYVRSLTSNNTVSSSKPKRRDWDRLIRFCLDNREADIGGFFRRHLGVSVDIDLLRSSFSLPQTLDQQAIELLDNGYARFLELNEKNSLPDVGYVEIGISINGSKRVEFKATQSFLERMQQRKVNYSGWPPFIYIHNKETKAWNPFVHEKGWEANIIAPPIGMGPATIDFWRLDPTGRFYTIRALQDDMNSSGIPPLTFLDPILHVRRIAEVLAVGLSFAQSMEYELEQTEIAFAFRWSRLSGRSLHTWANPNRMLRIAPTSVEDEAVETCLIPADTPLSAISQYVEKIGSGLFCHFDGYDRIGSNVIEEVVLDTIRS